ncbi:hypothetical protein F5ESL0233_02125 [Lactobacillus sp. ESL0233]|nr:hypothetical protein F5ESL0233_02125 [Lactobacillus sp. ESL0233]
MNYNFTLLLFTSILIIVSSFSLVFSFDRQKNSYQRKKLFLIATIGFIIAAILMVIILESPLATIYLMQK